MRDFADRIPLTTPSTEPIHIHSYKFNAPLLIHEIVEEMGGIESLESSAFTFSQIIALGRLHPGPDKKTRQKAILNYGEVHHFPVRKRTGGDDACFPLSKK